MPSRLHVSPSIVSSPTGLITLLKEVEGDQKSFSVGVDISTFHRKKAKRVFPPLARAMILNPGCMHNRIT